MRARTGARCVSDPLERYRHIVCASIRPMGGYLAGGNVADRQISVIVETVAGRVTDMLLKMIALYRPDCQSFSGLPSVA